MANIHIARAQQSLGSFGEAEVREGIRSGRFTANDLVWREGMETWKPLGEMAPQWGLETLPPTPETVVEASPLDVVGGDESEPAWEERKTIGFFPAISRTVNAVMMRPTQTFASLRHTGGLTTPLLYAVLLNATLHTLVGLISLISVLRMTPQEFQSVWQAIQQAFQGVLSSGQITISKTTYEFLLAGSILLWPVIEVVGYFLGAGVLHLSLLMVGGAKRPFETTFRTTCYVCGTFNAVAVFLDFVPGGAAGIMISLGAFLAYLCWYSYGTVVAYKEAQGIGVGRVMLASVIASVAFSCVTIAIGIIISPFVMAMMGITAKMPTQ